MKKTKLFLLPLIIVLISGCSLGVQPWERDVLARDAMMFDNEALDIAFDSHIYFSKEATSGGSGIGGGGCGCN